MTSIPVYSIIIRYNLLETGYFSKPWALFLSVIFPWLLIIPFYTGSGLLTLINWSSLIFTGASNYIFPFIIYAAARRHKSKLSAERQIQLDEEVEMEELDEDATTLIFSNCPRLFPTFASTGSTHSIRVKSFFAFPKSWMSTTVIIMALVMASQMTLLILGVLLSNILMLVEPARIWLGAWARRHRNNVTL